VTETLSSPVAAAPTLASLLSPVPEDWGVWDCQRLATAAEMAACSNRCEECGKTLLDKHGWPAGGTVIGYRFGPTDLWVWSPVLCRSCEIAHSIADGYK
jgi:hypothetical protein